MDTFQHTAAHFAQILACPTDLLLVRISRLALLSAAGRIFRTDRSPTQLLLLRLVLGASSHLPVQPGADPAAVLKRVHGQEAVGVTYCYGHTRRTRYLIRDGGSDRVIVRAPTGKETSMVRSEFLNLLRGYRFADVYVMPVPIELAAPHTQTADTTAATQTPQPPPAAPTLAPATRPGLPAFSAKPISWKPGRGAAQCKA